MKKTIAVLMLGSALLLPNNNNVEASYSANKVQVTSSPVQCYVWKGQLYDTKTNKKMVDSYRYHWKKSYGKNKVEVVPAPSKPVESPAPVKPVEKPAPTKPTPAPTPTPAPEKPTEVAPSTPVETPQDASISAIEKAVLDLTNAERQKAGLKPLQTDKNLMTSARQKSADMASKKYFSHTSPTYGSPFDQMKANGVTYKAAAENIAMGQRTAEEVVKGWMESPGHRQNILTPGYTHIGIGFDKNGNYWTQQFIQK
ncbi:CAP domain-containing protein [Sporosarcina beigongshangi]|uniref:CAP domain-containing protein n=1 Tax=Sporosarcina beigongshangi TaxID=2782538 RepID=UPI001939C6DF|nr:CAP domain-containing protein [Sporosarcina beigongshangi]